MSLSDAKPMYSFGSTSPPPSPMRWLYIDYPIHVGCRCGGYDMVIVNARTGAEMLVPGVQSEEPAVEREVRRWAA